MLLRLKAIVKTEHGRLDYTDQRRKLNSTIAAYYGEDGHEYRKSFEAYGVPIVPEQGTHKELNAKQKQY